MSKRFFVPVVLASALITSQVATAADMPVKAVAAPAPAWTGSFDTELRYFSWRRYSGNLPGAPDQRGNQTYLPITATLSGPLANDLKADFLVRGGYVNTSRSALPFAPGLGVPFSTGTVSTATDTIVNSTFTYSGFKGFELYYALNLNLPTGTTALFGTKGIARTDSDLVDVPGFGEGFNHGHTIGVSIPLSVDTVLGFSGGYTSRGAYDREQASAATVLGTTAISERVRPGDIQSAAATITSAFGALTLNGALSATFFNRDRLDNADTIRSGRSLLVSGGATYVWNPTWTTSFNASFSNTQRLFAADPVTGALLQEPFNSNSNLLRMTLQQDYSWEKYVFSASLGYLKRFQNEYNPLVQAFVPAKTKWTLGTGVKYRLSQRVTLSTRGEYFWIDEEVKPDFSGAGAVDGLPQKYRGALIAVGANVTF